MTNKTDVELRYEILRVINDKTKQQGRKKYKLYPVQIDNATYSDIGYHLKFLESKKLVEFQPRSLMRVYEVAITEEGSGFVENLAKIFVSKDENAMKELIAILK